MLYDASKMSEEEVISRYYNNMWLTRAYANCWAQTIMRSHTSPAASDKREYALDKLDNWLAK